MDDPQPKVAVITVNWNRPTLTISCYNALKTSVEIDWHLFIIDNGSTDESVQILSKLLGNVSLIETGINSGWAGGNNKGVKTALNQNFEWIFLLNNDAIVNETTLSELWKAAVHAPYSTPVIGAVQFDREGGDSFFGNRDISNSVFHAGITEAEFDRKPNLYETSVVKGAALFCHKSHFDSIGMFDERFFLNFEEVDWCVRARKLGFEILMNKKATVEHSGSGSMGGYKSPMSTYFLVRNGLLYAEMHGGLKKRLTATRAFFDWARIEFNTNSWIIAGLQTLKSRSPWAISFKLGVRDYILRRFGDCPSFVRTLTYKSKYDNTS